MNGRSLLAGLLASIALPVLGAESHPGLSTSYGALRLRDAVELQTIVTRPERATGKLPAILFVQWLSCSPVAISENPRDGWSAMLRRVVRESNALVWRTEKRGVGASGGTCATMDYDTELADHREALAHLRERPDVDPRRIVIFGGSIGGTYAPLLAADQELAGVMIWGAGATTWAERTLAFERSALELGDLDAAHLASEMQARYRFLDRYLVRSETPSQIAASDAELGKVWSRIVGTGPADHYGRPFAFHQQAQRADWSGAWARVKAPVLALYGEYDWFESRNATSLIARIVNDKSPGRATFIEVPRLNHHFEEYANTRDAFAEKNGRVNADAAVKPMLTWFARVTK